jgi:hypothetical protein
MIIEINKYKWIELRKPQAQTAICLIPGGHTEYLNRRKVLYKGNDYNTAIVHADVIFSAPEFKLFEYSYLNVSTEKTKDIYKWLKQNVEDFTFEVVYPIKSQYKASNFTLFSIKLIEDASHFKLVWL